jgi:UDP-glucose 4-epimerase
MLKPETRVLVTGGCGFIGTHLVFQLLVRGCKVTVLDDLSTGRVDLDNARNGMMFRQGSVLVPSDVEDAADFRSDVIIHLASVVGQIPAKRNPRYSHRVSVEGLQNVLQRTSQSAPIVVLSSSAVYGTELRGPVREEQAYIDRAFEYDGGEEGYAVGKLRAEELALQWNGYGRPVLIVRPFNVVGPGQTGEYGMVLPRLLAGDEMEVYGDGSQTRAFSHVEKFVEVLLELVQSEAWSHPNPVFNVGTTESTSIMRLAEAINEGRVARPIVLVPYEQRFPGHADVPERTPDISKLESVIGPVSWPSLEEIVRDTIQG